MITNVLQLMDWLFYVGANNMCYVTMIHFVQEFY